MTKPFLRWAGSKGQLVRSMATYWSGRYTRYVEPFAGSARFFFEVQPPSALLGDINSDLMSMYEVVRTHPSQLYMALSQWSNNKDEYYRIRALDPANLDDIVRAARFIYLNRFCFNGLYRTNKAGKFNVPYGGDRSGTIPSEDELAAASKLFSRAKLIRGDFETTLKGAKASDFIYLDPPYTTRGKKVFNDYGPQSFGSEDLARLRAVLDKLHEIGATFLLSYADCPEGSVLARNFKIRRVKARRNIAGFASSRRVTSELLVTNAGI